MKCERVNLGDGTVAIICSRGQRRTRCSTPGCNRQASKLCDFPLAGAKAGKTCDRGLCASCAVNMGEVIRLSADPRWQSHKLRMASSKDTVDFCPAHAKQTREAEPTFTTTSTPIRMTISRAELEAAEKAAPTGG